MLNDYNYDIELQIFGLKLFQIDKNLLLFVFLLLLLFFLFRHEVLHTALLSFRNTGALDRSSGFEHLHESVLISNGKLWTLKYAFLNLNEVFTGNSAEFC